MLFTSARILEQLTASQFTMLNAGLFFNNVLMILMIFSLSFDADFVRGKSQSFVAASEFAKAVTKTRLIPSFTHHHGANNNSPLRILTITTTTTTPEGSLGALSSSASSPFDPAARNCHQPWTRFLLASKMTLDSPLVR